MSSKTTADEKTVADQLTFGPKTSKRVTWEAWEFTVVGPHRVRVTNASYGYLKADHTYTVGVEVRDGQALPAECDCPADTYREEYDCKHKLALATVGGPSVLNAAVEFEAPTADEGTVPETMADKLRADGGLPARAGRASESACPNGDPRCNGPDGVGLECFACYEPEGSA